MRAATAAAATSAIISPRSHDRGRRPPRVSDHANGREFTRARSSVGQSRRLIIVWSLVRSPAGPTHDSSSGRDPRPLILGPPFAPGGVQIASFRGTYRQALGPAASRHPCNPMSIYRSLDEGIPSEINVSDDPRRRGVKRRRLHCRSLLATMRVISAGRRRPTSSARRRCSVDREPAARHSSAGAPAAVPTLPTSWRKRGPIRRRFAITCSNC